LAVGLAAIPATTQSALQVDVIKQYGGLVTVQRRGGEIRTGSRSEVVGSGWGGWAVEDPGSQIGRLRSRAKTGARRMHDARWRVAFAMAGGGARAPDRMLSARVTLRGGYKKCRLQ